VVFLDGFATKAGRAKAGQAKGELGYTLGSGAGLGGFGSVSPSLFLELFAFLAFPCSFVHLQV